QNKFLEDNCLNNLVQIEITKLALNETVLFNGLDNINNYLQLTEERITSYQNIPKEPSSINNWYMDKQIISLDDELLFNITPADIKEEMDIEEDDTVKEKIVILEEAIQNVR